MYSNNYIGEVLSYERRADLNKADMMYALPRLAVPAQFVFRAAFALTIGT